MKMGGALNAERLTFWNTLARELLKAVHFPMCSSGISIAPQTFTLQLANRTQLAHHYIQYALAMNYFQQDFFKVPRGHSSTEMTLERASSNIKVTTKNKHEQSANATTEISKQL